jgi:hypothetical protein
MHINADNIFERFYWEDITAGKEKADDRNRQLSVLNAHLAP